MKLLRRSAALLAALLAAGSMSTVDRWTTGASAQAVLSATASVDPATERELLELARTFLQARTYRLLSTKNGDPVPPPALPPSAVSPELGARVTAVDRSLDQLRNLLGNGHQRYLVSTMVVEAREWKQLPNGRLGGFLTEKTSLTFDRDLDPEAPEATRQIVERVFIFEYPLVSWRIADYALEKPYAMTPINDGPRQIADSPDERSSGTGTWEDNGIESLSDDDRAEDARGEPVPVPDPPAAADPNGRPLGSATKPTPSRKLPPGGSLNGYDYQHMANYTYFYWNNYNRGYRAFANDCTNFISQIMRFGGWPYDYGYFRYPWNWWYSAKTQTWTWAGADNWWKFARAKRAAPLNDLWYMVRTDVLVADWDRDGNKNHVMIVSIRTPRHIYLAYHTNDTYDMPLAALLHLNGGAAFFALRT